MDDWQLLEAWRGGNGASGEALVGRYMGLLTRFFRNKVSNPEDVRERGGERGAADELELKGPDIVVMLVAHRQFQRLPRELFTRPSVIDPVGLLVGR